MSSVRVLTKKEFYEEIDRDPDLRRLGEYRVVADPGMEIFPIDLDLSGRELYLGEGDFTGTFVAFGNTKADKVDFGSCRFSQVYLDYLEVRLLSLHFSQASSLMFDRAEIDSCDFGEFEVQELYFDELSSEVINIEDLSAGRIFVGDLKPTEVKFENRGPEEFKILFDEGGSQTIGELKREELGDFNYREPEDEEKEGARSLSVQEFMALLEEGTSLRSLGMYRIVPEDGGEVLEISTAELGEIDFGRGDFRNVEVRFVNPEMSSISFDLADFGSIVFEGGRIGTVDLAKAKAEKLVFRGTEIGTVFCDGVDASHCEFDEVEIEYMFLNNILCESLEFTNSEINEIYASRGEHEDISFDNCEVRLFNGHEAKFKTIHFGKSEFGRVVMRATTVEDLVDASELKAERFMIGYYDNNIENMEVKESTLGTEEGIQALTFRKLEPSELDREHVEARRQE